MRIPFYNLHIDLLNEKEALLECQNTIAGEKTKSLYFINAHCFNVAQKNKDYQLAIQRSDYILNDGIGISIAGKLAGTKFPDNLNGTDFIPKIIALGTQHQKSFYLLGSKTDHVEKTKCKLEKVYPGIQIKGVHDGFFSEDQEPEIVRQINQLGIDILIVGMGVPRQELWIDKYKNELSSVKLCIAGGAIIDFMSGNIKRAPVWIRKIYFEWIYRLMLEPKRMWKRYLFGNFIFFVHIFRNLIQKNK
jgi:N-acetylglucosaminyldiphosphoundecaprenol N-acetyl-beta-D-mannosaminyltransferase